ncbi:MAG TPA: hypothetical protein VGV09_11535 [Steroidobacteraceae bacterium]|nr:hypothetical protein [Steroidobacteraceae bacterium]
MSAKKDSLENESPTSTSSTAERRRIAKIVHDDRDTASVEWLDAPPDYERIPLSIEGTLPRGTKRAQTGYNPYETISPNKAAGPDKRPAKRDLRKLSEWIKQMRELEARKKSGEPDED